MKIDSLWNLTSFTAALLVFTTGCLSSKAPPPPQLCVVTLTNSAYRGERAALMALSQELTQEFAGTSWSQEVDAATTESPVDAITFPSGCHSKVVLAAGDHGIQWGLALSKQLRPPAFVHISTRLLTKHTDLVGVAQVVVVPAHGVEAASHLTASFAEDPRSQLLTSPGIVHGVSKKDLKSAYREFSHLLPKVSRPMAVVLAGDTSVGQGHWQIYTPQEALEFSRRVASLAKSQKRHIIVLNGPRTGLHDPMSGEEVAGVHRTGLPDAVSQAFTNGLIEEGVDFSFYDDQEGQPHLFKATLGFLEATGGPILVPGEATYLVATSAHALPGLTTVYFHSAMTPLHESHILWQFKHGHVHMWRRGEKEPLLTRSLATAPAVDPITFTTSGILKALGLPTSPAPATKDF